MNIPELIKYAFAEPGDEETLRIRPKGSEAVTRGKIISGIGPYS